jgi:hypothetical protein
MGSKYCLKFSVESNVATSDFGTDQCDSEQKRILGFLKHRNVQLFPEKEKKFMYHLIVIGSINFLSKGHS